MSKYNYGYIYAITAAFFYALVAIVGKRLVTQGAHPFLVTFYQYLFSILIIGIWIAVRNRSAFRCSLKTVCQFALLGIIGGGAMYIFFYSTLKYLDAGISSMLIFLHPIFITVFFAVTRIKKMKPINYLAVFTAACGAAIVLNIFSGSLNLSAVGIMFGLLSAVTYGFYSVFADLKLKKEDPMVINFYSSLAALLFTLLMLVGNDIGFSVDRTVLPPIFFLAVFSGVIPPYLYFKALQYIGSEKVSVISSIELPLTLIMAFIILEEQMRSIQLLGIFLVVMATVLLRMNEKELVEDQLS